MLVALPASTAAAAFESVGGVSRRRFPTQPVAVRPLRWIAAEGPFGGGGIAAASPFTTMDWQDVSFHDCVAWNGGAAFILHQALVQLDNVVVRRCSARTFFHHMGVHACVRVRGCVPVCVCACLCVCVF